METCNLLYIYPSKYLSLFFVKLYHRVTEIRTPIVKILDPPLACACSDQGKVTHELAIPSSDTFLRCIAI